MVKKFDTIQKRIRCMIKNGDLAYAGYYDGWNYYTYGTSALVRIPGIEERTPLTGGLLYLVRNVKNTLVYAKPVYLAEDYVSVQVTKKGSKIEYYPVTKTPGGKDFYVSIGIAKKLASRLVSDDSQIWYSTHARAFLLTGPDDNFAWSILIMPCIVNFEPGMAERRGEK